MFVATARDEVLLRKSCITRVHGGQLRAGVTTAGGDQPRGAKPSTPAEARGVGRGGHSRQDTSNIRELSPRLLPRNLSSTNHADLITVAKHYLFH